MSARIRVSAKSERTFDGILFASKAEMKRYAELLMLERAGVIHDLERQPRFVLIEPFVHPLLGKCHGLTYVADFRYREGAKQIIEDVKGHITEVYKIKRMLLLLRYPDINFREEKA
jgi:hypothetical protein